LPPVRAITRGTRQHWFGYYDKLQLAPTCRLALGMQVACEHRSPRPNDAIRVGMVDLARGDRWTDLGSSHAWNWQQGCMLQWLPGSRTEVIWNDRSRSNDGFVAHLRDVRSGRRRTLPGPVYCLAPDARFALACDFSRLNDTRPGYGYAGVPDPNRDLAAPSNAGIWRMPMTGRPPELLLSFAEVAAFQPPKAGWVPGTKHWFNHLLCAPDGKRFVFLHRWRRPGAKGFETRMLTATVEGGDMFVLDPHGKTSHFIWRDPSTILAWAHHPSHGEKFYLYEDRTDRVQVIGPEVMTVNGHCTYLPGNAWILNDTYPDQDRLQHPYLFRVATGQRVPLGHFRSPAEYSGEWRCDNHPRFSPDGTKVIIDSPHGGGGRQMYLIDISGIVGPAAPT